MTELNNQYNTRPSFLGNFRRFFLTGLLVTAPIIITIYVTWLVITFIDTKVANLLPEYLDFRKALPFQVPGLGLFIVIVVITFIGAITPGLIGRNLLKLGEMILFKTPVIRTIYSSIKQIMETVMSTNSKSFKEVVLVEYPRKNIWVIAFVTSSIKGEIDKSIRKADLVSIFVPTTPNPTSGFLLFVSKKDLIYLKMPVEQAVKLVISGGIVVPKQSKLST
ncbi:MAG: hypothetical protein CMN44_01845 [SAR116 cluster bacterium]|nr:hypothetical protein [SAR116 cluster bacterium]RPH11561.1 MAG: DUF502 domain-containing protein [Alphaproteobacteria bacterium TMED54]